MLMISIKTQLLQKFLFIRIFFQCNHLDVNRTSNDNKYIYWTFKLHENTFVKPLWSAPVWTAGISTTVRLCWWIQGARCTSCLKWVRATTGSSCIFPPVPGTSTTTCGWVTGCIYQSQPAATAQWAGTSRRQEQRSDSLHQCYGGIFLPLILSHCVDVRFLCVCMLTYSCLHAT